MKKKKVEAKLKKAEHKVKKMHKKEDKIKKVMHEYKEGKLHSGSKKGPKVKKEGQALAIALSEARRATKKSKKNK